MGKRYHRWRAERVERAFAHVCETGGARRTRSRGRANVAKRCLLQAAGANLALVMRPLHGLGTPRGWADRAQGALLGLLGSAIDLLLWWTAYCRSPFVVTRPEAAWAPPGADLTTCPAPRRAGTSINGLLAWLLLKGRTRRRSHLTMGTAVAVNSGHVGRVAAKIGPVSPGGTRTPHSCPAAAPGTNIRADLN